MRLSTSPLTLLTAWFLTVLVVATGCAPADSRPASSTATGRASHAAAPAPSQAEPGQLELAPPEQSEPDVVATPAPEPSGSAADQEAPFDPDSGTTTFTQTMNGAGGVERPRASATMTAPDSSAESSRELQFAMNGGELRMSDSPANFGATTKASSAAKATAGTAPELPGAATKNDAGFTREVVFFATDRNRSGEIKPATCYASRRGELEFGTCDVSIPYAHKTGEIEARKWYQWSENPKEHILLLDPMNRMSEAAWVARIREKLSKSTQRDVMVFIHGYNVTFESAIQRTAQLAYDLNFPGAAVCYSWPSGNKLNYTTDLANAEWTVPHCQQVLRQIALHCRAERVHLIAHSMGSRVLTLALKDLSQGIASLSDRPLFNQVILAAPDLDADVFRTQIAPAIAKASQRMTIYVSQKDRALGLSKGLNGYERLGALKTSLTSDLEATWLECVDASNLFDDSWLNMRHAYYGDSPELIADLRRVLNGESARDRGLASDERGRFSIVR